jgi:hypothetical protein
MPTSTENPKPDDLRLEGEHWDELIAVLGPKSIESLDSFDAWVTEQAKFSSPNAIKKSLRG